MERIEVTHRNDRPLSPEEIEREEVACKELREATARGLWARVAYRILDRRYLQELRSGEDVSTSRNGAAYHLGMVLGALLGVAGTLAVLAIASWAVGLFFTLGVIEAVFVIAGWTLVFVFLSRRVRIHVARLYRKIRPKKEKSE